MALEHYKVTYRYERGPARYMIIEAASPELAEARWRDSCPYPEFVFLKIKVYSRKVGSTRPDGPGLDDRYQ
jgi:hypothetical protein